MLNKIRQLIKKYTRSQDTPSMRVEIAYLFWIKCLSDKKILRILKIHGYQIEFKKLCIIRKSMGMYRRLTQTEINDDADQKLQEIIEQELERGNITLAGRRSVWMHLRNMGVLASHHRIGQALKIVDPIGVENRLKGVNRHHAHFICPGPNWCWSIDGHLKLQMFGIEIYAAIDAYSRYVTWFYSGVSGKTGVSVLSQFLEVMQKQNCLPLHIRADRGTETMLLAESFWELHKDHNPDITFPEVFWYGTSTRNVRIESWWGQLTKGATADWKKYFRTLQQGNLFQEDRLEDMIAILYTYMPIIRAKLHQFVENWNNHKIRKQSNRPNLPTGEPYYNYYFPPDGVNNYEQIPSLNTIESIRDKKLKNSYTNEYYGIS
ncbi:uncharacterized protein LAJ45_08978 [Morchella importuna]|uniref:uncharacterized protein n=1 Tax=Morchella importuna TaxID=1174673 RepID=UPI001E8DB6B3|nr:uncharacterized protein LAJ45_08978 [Morchella importuna]KAH8146899.1 hypothetical protein LAJ45_08978 [Morchella importuna]